MDVNAILNKPIHTLGLSNEFYLSCKIMGFDTLKDVMMIEPKELISKDGFSYKWFGELISFLSECDMLYVLQPLPGQPRFK